MQLCIFSWIKKQKKLNCYEKTNHIIFFFIWHRCYIYSCYFNYFCLMLKTNQLISITVFMFRCRASNSIALITLHYIVCCYKVATEQASPLYYHTSYRVLHLPHHTTHHGQHPLLLQHNSPQYHHNSFIIPPQSHYTLLITISSHNTTHSPAPHDSLLTQSSRHHATLQRRERERERERESLHINIYLCISAYYLLIHIHI